MDFDFEQVTLELAALAQKMGEQTKLAERQQLEVAEQIQGLKEAVAASKTATARLERENGVRERQSKEMQKAIKKAVR